MVNVGPVERIPQEVVGQDLEAKLREAIRKGEECLDAELEGVLGAGWYERVSGRRDHRNGHYRRQLLTSLGRVELAVPRRRGGAVRSQVVATGADRGAALVPVSRCDVPRRPVGPAG